MSLIYLLTLAAVGVVLLALVWDAVRSVSRRPDWAGARSLVPRAVAANPDRRQHALPYIGTERRTGDPVNVVRSSEVEAHTPNPDVAHRRAA